MKFRELIHNDFLGICIQLGYYFCIIPEKAVTTDKIESRNYFFYTCIVRTLILYCHICQWVKMYQIITADIFIFDELVRNCAITSIHFQSFVKTSIFRQNYQLFENVIDFENVLYKNNDQKVLLIYRDTLQAIKNSRLVYVFGILIVIVFYIAAPLFRGPYYVEMGNETVTIIQLPLSAWSPTNNYFSNFAVTGAMGAYLAMVFVQTDLLYYCFLYFSICQLNILEHYIVHFHHYSNELVNDHKCSHVMALSLTQKIYIKYHQNIIKNVKQLNDALKNSLLIDLVPSSIQFANQFYIIATNLNIMQCVCIGFFTIMLMSRVMAYCYLANQISVQSQKIGSAWFQMDWSDFPNEMKKMISFCIMRAQKPLVITLGNFGNITLMTFVGILQASYSYVMLFITL
uniref:Odorant receptor n=1 Tax=Ips typographus TaxID=55986 RepID=M3V898_IPSTY